MQKKVIKRKRPNSTSSYRSKASITLKIAALLFIVAVLLISYITLGVEITLIVAIGIAIILGIAFILGRIRSKKKRKKIVSIFLILMLLAGISGLIGFSVFMMYVKKQADPKFKPDELNTAEVSRLYDKDGNQFAKLGSEKREKVKYEQLPEVLVDAIVATEDSRFFQHNGFDAPRFLKAFIGQVAGNSGAGGASTLSMQVVKNVFTDKYGQKTSGFEGITRKFEDIYLAVFKLEKKYSKEEIIEYYVNNHFLGGNIYGVEEASNTYFGKSVSELNLSEAAILAGMFKSPNAYKPTTNPENAAARRKRVLYYMRIHGYITKEEEEIANAIPVNTLVADQQQVTENPYQGYIDTVVDELEEEYGISPYTTPLLVYTNLDRGRQDAVSRVLAGDGYEWKDDLIQSGVAVLESETGKILAIGNGRNVRSRTNATIDQYNFATEIKRQPGSTAKPLFDYGPGIEYNGWSTYQLFDDAPYSYSNGRSIKNWDGGYYGTITLRKALSASRNIPALKAFQSVDNNKIREFVTNLGITPEICSSGYNYNKDTGKCVNSKDKSDTEEPERLHEAHSIGAFTGVSPLEMAGAYAGFSNGGYYNKPYSVNKIVFRQTKETREHVSDKKQVMSDATAFMISSVLQDVSLTGGTPHNVACKTGTTNFDDRTMDNMDMPYDAIRDSWVIGYSTKTTIGMWYGYENTTKDLVAQGYVLHNIPATIAKDRLFNALVAAGAMEGDRAPFNQPSSVVKIGVSSGSNPPKLAVPGGGAVYEYFKKGAEPTEYDTANYKLAAPTNVKISDSNGKVSISWSAVDPGVFAAENHGKFGYNIYKDGVLIDWTESTSYSFTPSGSVYGTYKIVASYKSYNGIQSNEAVVKYSEKPTTVSVTGISLNKSSTSISVGNTETLISSISPSTATNKTVTWSSSDSSVATVDQNGKVTGIKEGKATIKVETKDGNKSASCVVTITPTT